VELREPVVTMRSDEKDSISKLKNRLFVNNSMGWRRQLDQNNRAVRFEKNLGQN
jgi:hypothetical protein